MNAHGTAQNSTSILVAGVPATLLLWAWCTWLASRLMAIRTGPALHIRVPAGSDFEHVLHIVWDLPPAQRRLAISAALFAAFAVAHRYRQGVA